MLEIDPCQAIKPARGEAHWSNQFPVVPETIPDPAPSQAGVIPDVCASCTRSGTTSDLGDNTRNGGSFASLVFRNDRGSHGQGRGGDKKYISHGPDFLLMFSASFLFRMRLLMFGWIFCRIPAMACSLELTGKLVKLLRDRFGFVPRALRLIGLKGKAP